MRQWGYGNDSFVTGAQNISRLWPSSVGMPTSNHGRLLNLRSREVPLLTDINEESLCLAYASYPLLIEARDQVGSDLCLIFEHKMA